MFNNGRESHVMSAGNLWRTYWAMSIRMVRMRLYREAFKHLAVDYPRTLWNNHPQDHAEFVQRTVGALILLVGVGQSTWTGIMPWPLAEFLANTFGLDPFSAATLTVEAAVIMTTILVGMTLVTIRDGEFLLRQWERVKSVSMITGVAVVCGGPWFWLSFAATFTLWHWTLYKVIVHPFEPAVLVASLILSFVSWMAVIIIGLGLAALTSDPRRESF